jgi:hypothetical protein
MVLLERRPARVRRDRRGDRTLASEFTRLYFKPYL